MAKFKASLTWILVVAASAGASPPPPSEPEAEVNLKFPSEPGGRRLTWALVGPRLEPNRAGCQILVMDLNKSIKLEYNEQPLPWKAAGGSVPYSFHAGDTATLRLQCPEDGVTKARFAIAHSGDHGYLNFIANFRDHVLVEATLELDPTHGPLPKQFRLARDTDNEFLECYDLIPIGVGDKAETKSTIDVKHP